jgi:hypothetical protein
MWPFSIKSCQPSVDSPSDPATEPAVPQTAEVTYDLSIHYVRDSSDRYSFSTLERASRRFYELNDSIAKGDRVFMVSHASGSDIIVLQNITHVELAQPPLSRDAIGVA